LVRRVYKCANPNITHLANAKTGPTLEGWAVFANRLFSLFRAGHKLRSAHRTVDMLKVDAPRCRGEIKPPHFGHTASSDARTFSRLIFRERGMIWAF
jgi:hypothetical protein